MTNGREVIPNRWNYRKISEVTTKVGSGSTPRGGESVYQDSGVPLIRSMNVHSSGFKSDGLAFIDADEARKLDHVIVQPSDVLLNITGASIGRVTTAPNALAGARVNQHVCIIRPKEELSSSFLSYFLASPNEQARVMNVQVGATRQALTKAMILDWDVPVPPFHEQQEIVAEIEKQFSRLDDAVANLKRVKANLKRYKAAVLKAAVEGKLTEDWRKQHPNVEPASKLLERILAERRAKWSGRGKYKEPAKPNTSNFPPLPEGWVWASPDQLSEAETNSICAGPFGTIFKAKDFRSAGVPIIFLRHVAPGRYLTHKPGFMEESKWKELFQPYSVFGGELLVTKLGEPPGVCAIYPEGIGPAMVTPDVIKMSVNPGVVLPKFLMHYFNSESARRFSSGVAFGTTRLRLTLPIFYGMPVPLPQLAEQQQIVAEVERRLSVIDELEATVEANLTRTDRLRQSILSGAFSGRLFTREILPTHSERKSVS